MRAAPDNATVDRLPWVIPVSCEGCGSCVSQCPTGGLQMTGTNAPGVFVPWLKDPSLCVGCGRCCRVCAMGAISMTRYTDMAAKRFNTAPALPLERDSA